VRRGIQYSGVANLERSTLQNVTCLTLLIPFVPSGESSVT
jgi:hypothetical protein